jgi:hypothetical protein
MFLYIFPKRLKKGELLNDGSRAVRIYQNHRFT